MPQIIITVENGELVRQGLADFASSLPKIGRLQLYRAALRVNTRLGVYPNKLPGQVYKRTYTARASRAVQKIEKGYMVIFDPIDKRGKPYGVYLRGTPTDANTQARYHRGRWTPYAVILDEELAKLPEEVIAAIKVEAEKAAREVNTRGRTV